jgi:hypothetical protein
MIMELRSRRIWSITRGLFSRANVRMRSLLNYEMAKIPKRDQSQIQVGNTNQRNKWANTDPPIYWRQLTMPFTGERTRVLALLNRPQEMLTLPWHLMTHPIYTGVCVSPLFFLTCKSDMCFRLITIWHLCHFIKGTALLQGDIITKEWKYTDLKKSIVSRTTWPNSIKIDTYILE